MQKFSTWLIIRNLKVKVIVTHHVSPFWTVIVNVTMQKKRVFFSVCCKLPELIIKGKWYFNTNRDLLVLLLAIYLKEGISIKWCLYECSFRHCSQSSRYKINWSDYWHMVVWINLVPHRLIGCGAIRRCDFARVGLVLLQKVFYQEVNFEVWEVQVRPTGSYSLTIVFWSRCRPLSYFSSTMFASILPNLLPWKQWTKTQ